MLDIELLLRLASDHLWFLLAAVVIGGIVRALKLETPPINAWFSRLPPLAKFVVPMVLGGLAGFFESLAANHNVTEAIVKGVLLSGLIPIVGHEAIIETIRGGREFGDEEVVIK